MPLRKEVVEIIEIDWDGPFTREKIIKDYTGPEDRGVYQIYGTHEVFGPDSLLYIGQTTQQYFSARMSQHYDWLDFWIPSEIKIYLGRLGGIEKITTSEWKKTIEKAERLLIFFASPPFNSQFIVGGKSLDNIRATVIINFGKKHRLPLEVSTLSLAEESYFGENNWQHYGSDALFW